MTSKSTSLAVFASISHEEKDRAKKVAKSKGMTFQGWLGNLIKDELKNAEAANGTRN